MAATITESNNKFHLQRLIDDQGSNPLPIKVVAVETPDTVDDGDHVTITLSNYGISQVWDVWAWTHTTKDDVIAHESTEMVTAVTSGSLRVTVQGSTDNKKRVILVWGV